MDQHQKDLLPSRCPISMIINLNNEGVAHLKSGDYKTAIATFLCGLQGCKQQILACRDGETDTRSMDEYMALSSKNSNEDGNEDENEDGDNQVIYRHAIIVRETQRDRLNKTCQNTATATMMSTIIIFNEALAHHLMALEVMKLQQEKKAFKILSQAAKLYEMGLILAQQGELCSSGSLFVLASINNMALVYIAMNANDVANHCLEKLLATLMFVIDSGDSVKFDGFFANTSYLIFSASPAAAAA
jgi:tetratricopeptide (TPR) repeat protein